MTAKYKKGMSFFEMDSLQGIEETNFSIIKNPVSTSGLALTSPQ